MHSQIVSYQPPLQSLAQARTPPYHLMVRTISILVRALPTYHLRSSQLAYSPPNKTLMPYPAAPPPSKSQSFASLILARVV